MLGSPILRAAAALAALLLLLVPLRMLTATRTPVAMINGPATPPAAAHLEIVSTKTPFKYSVAHLGNVIWEGEAGSASVATDVRLPIPDEGIDLALQVDWPSAGEAAAKLILTHGTQTSERTVWGDGSASDVLTYP